MWILFALFVSVVANDNLRVAYQWKQIDFEYPNIEERQAAIANETFIQENVMPVGLEVYKNRLFITLPRWKKGVPASLAYIDLNGKLRFVVFSCLCDGSRCHWNCCNITKHYLDSVVVVCRIARTINFRFLLLPEILIQFFSRIVTRFN